MTEYIHALREAILNAEERTPEPSSSDTEASRVQLQEALSDFIPGKMKDWNVRIVAFPSSIL